MYIVKKVLNFFCGRIFIPFFYLLESDSVNNIHKYSIFSLFTNKAKIAYSKKTKVF